MNLTTPYLHVVKQHKARRTPVKTRRSPSAVTHSPELSRLLSAAVVNCNFRRLLLVNPTAALAQGFNGETFNLPPEEEERVLSIRADTLESFAKQLLSPTAKTDETREAYRTAPKAVNDGLQKASSKAGEALLQTFNTLKMPVLSYGPAPCDPAQSGG